MAGQFRGGVLRMVKVGSLVRVRAFGGEVLERRVVADGGAVVFISTDRELEAARREGREPLAVGFKRDLIVDDLEAEEDDEVMGATPEEAVAERLVRHAIPPVGV